MGGSSKLVEMGDSKNKGTPKWMVKIMENPIKKMDDLWVKLKWPTPSADEIFPKHPWTRGDDSKALGLGTCQLSQPTLGLSANRGVKLIDVSEYEFIHLYMGVSNIEVPPNWMVYHGTPY